MTREENPKTMAEEDLMHLTIRSQRVGIIGLRAALNEVMALKGRPDAEIGRALLEKVAARNYLPGPKELYVQAFLREYKKALGEEVPAPPGELRVQIVGPPCACSLDLVQLVLNTLSELGLAAALDHLTDPAAFQRRDLTGLPALIINDEVKAIGNPPSRETLKRWLAAASTKGNETVGPSSDPDEAGG